jgi:hypothetical protein
MLPLLALALVAQQAPVCIPSTSFLFGLCQWWSISVPEWYNGEVYSFGFENNATYMQNSNNTLNEYMSEINYTNGNQSLASVRVGILSNINSTFVGIEQNLATKMQDASPIASNITATKLSNILAHISSVLDTSMGSGLVDNQTFVDTVVGIGGNSYVITDNQTNRASIQSNISSIIPNMSSHSVYVVQRSVNGRR